MRLIKRYGFRFLIIFTALIFLVGCDQTTKKAANVVLKDKPHKEIAGIINLQYVENDGGMLSLGSKLPDNVKTIIFIIIVSAFLLILFWYLLKNEQELFIKQSALVLILSGGLGNLIDRIFNSGNVIDFINVRLPLINRGIFNIADFYVTLGIVLIMILLLKDRFISQGKTNSA